MPPQLKEVAGVLQQQHLRKSYTPGDLLAKLQLDKRSAKTKTMAQSLKAEVWELQLPAEEQAQRAALPTQTLHAARVGGRGGGAAAGRGRGCGRGRG
eukprot:342706-Chlamydomonas_euryale.AAC.1